MLLERGWLWVIETEKQNHRLGRTIALYNFCVFFWTHFFSQPIKTIDYQILDNMSSQYGLNPSPLFLMLSPNSSESDLLVRHFVWGGWIHVHGFSDTLPISASLALSSFLSRTHIWTAAAGSPCGRLSFISTSSVRDQSPTILLSKYIPIIISSPQPLLPFFSQYLQEHAKCIF